MVPLKYIKKANKLYVGYCFFNNNHIFTTATNIDMIPHNMRLQFMKYKQPTKGIKYQMIRADEAELPYEHMSTRMHSRIKGRAEGRVKPVVRRRLPEFFPKNDQNDNPAKVADGSVQYMEQNGKLIVYKIIAEYPL